MPRYEKLNAPVPITYVSLLPLLTKLRERFLGKSLDPLNPATRHSMVLVAFLAWVGLDL